ncbi:MAG TPA: hypothetical protein DEP27_01745 [Ruminococcaceae bacterium]|nr:hypothetical protein [Oscillospiraceae bacterium]
MHSGEAYDFDLFENHVEERAKETPESTQPDNVIEMPQEDVAKKHKKARLHRHPLRVAAASVGLVVLVGIMGSFVYGQVQLSELAVEVSQADNSLGEQKSLYTQLQMKNDAKHSLSSVEKTATEQLGMTKVDSSQLETVEMNSSDKAQVLQKTGNDFLTRVWNRIYILLS